MASLTTAPEIGPRRILVAPRVQRCDDGMRARKAISGGDMATFGWKERYDTVANSRMRFTRAKK